MVFKKGNIPLNKGKRENIKIFWDKVEKTGTCWLWLAGKSTGGYGRFYYNGKTQYAHRIAWFLTHGKFPSKLLLHKCDIRLCVKPMHLFEGTYKDNNDDAINKGRRNYHKCQSSCWCKKKISKRRKITLKTAGEIRRKYIKQKYTVLKLSMEYNISCSSTWRIIKGDSYKF